MKRKDDPGRGYYRRCVSESEIPPNDSLTLPLSLVYYPLAIGGDLTPGHVQGHTQGLLREIGGGDPGATLHLCLGEEEATVVVQEEAEGPTQGRPLVLLDVAGPLMVILLLKTSHAYPPVLIHTSNISELGIIHPRIFYY